MISLNEWILDKSIRFDDDRNSVKHVLVHFDFRDAKLDDAHLKYKEFWRPILCIFFSISFHIRCREPSGERLQRAETGTSFGGPRLQTLRADAKRAGTGTSFRGTWTTNFEIGARRLGPPLGGPGLHELRSKGGDWDFRSGGSGLQT